MSNLRLAMRWHSMAYIYTYRFLALLVHVRPGHQNVPMTHLLHSCTSVHLQVCICHKQDATFDFQGLQVSAHTTEIGSG